MIAYRPDIDGLRAIAVGVVVIFHAFPFKLSGGFSGVDIFFVISGFLITSLIATELDHDKFSLLRFYQRRITRLYPALIAVMLSVLIAGWFLLFSREFQNLGFHLAGGSIFVSNFVMMGEAGYFAEDSAMKPLTHFWSLGVEEQFYLVWPLFLMIVCKQGVDRRRLLVLGIICTAALASFIYGLAVLREDQAQAYYSPLVRFWELLAGAFLAVRGKQLTEKPDPALAHAVSVIGLAILLAGAAVLIDSTTPYPGWHALLPVVGASLIIAAGPQAVVNRWLLSNRTMVFIGLISYPLYLWHWPILAFMRIVESGEPSTLARSIAVVLAVALAVATHLFIERPLQKFRSKPIMSIGLLSAVLGIGALGFGIYTARGMPTRLHVAAGDAVYAQITGPDWPYAENQACLNRHPMPESKNFQWWFCVQSSDKAPTLLVVGTSHANHLYPGLIKNASLAHHTVLNIGTCDVSWVPPDHLQATPAANYPCDGPRRRQQQDMIDAVASSGSVKFAIFAGLQTRGDDYVDRLLKRVEDFEAKGIRVILFAPQLKWAFEVSRCFPRPLRDTVATAECKLEHEALDEARAEFAPVALELVRRKSDILIFDPNDIFCSGDMCSIVRDGLPLYRDKYEHLSEFGSVKTVDLFVQWAKKKVPEILLQP